MHHRGGSRKNLALAILNHLVDNIFSTHPSNPQSGSSRECIVRILVRLENGNCHRKGSRPDITVCIDREVVEAVSGLDLVDFLQGVVGEDAVDGDCPREGTRDVD